MLDIEGMLQIWDINNFSLKMRMNSELAKCVKKKYDTRC